MNELLIFAPVILGGIYLFINQKTSNITAPNISEIFNPVQLNQDELRIGGVPYIYNNGIGNYYITEKELNLKKQNQKNKIIFTSSMCKFTGGMSTSLDDMINKINGFSQ
jgi:hypothetical protein